MGFEPTAPSLGSWYSTTELRPLIVCLLTDMGLYLSKLYHASIIASVCLLYVGKYGRSPIQLTFVARQALVCILRPGMNCDVLIHW